MTFTPMRPPLPEPGWKELPAAPTVSLGGLLAVAAFGLMCLGIHGFSAQGWFPILDSANLALHEAGHPLVGIFSERATVYGGTLFQLLFPAAAAWHFHRLGQAASMAASLVWFSENLFNIARYMADARPQELPLVGSGDHDWAEIFGRWGVLHLDGRIAGMTRGLGLLLIVWAVVWLYRRWREESQGTGSS